MHATLKHIELQAKDLAIGYVSGRKVLTIAKEINFRLESGSLTALVGANGVGKSTLVRSLTGMQKAISGEVFIKGKSFESYSHLRIAQMISVVLTELPASGNLSVRELISLGRQPYTNWMGSLTEADEKAIAFAFAITETSTLADKKCYELSDGQMQRVAIARALAQDTPIMILDEPTTHLDIYHRAYIFKLMKKLAKEYGKTVFFSTHEIDLAIELSDKILIMTGNDVLFDSPCGHIEKGHFNKLFPEDTIRFDRDSGRFSIK